MWLDRAVKWLLPREDHFFDLLDRGADAMVLAGRLVGKCRKAPSLAARSPLIQRTEDAGPARDHCNHAHRIEHDADQVFRKNTAYLFKHEKDAIKLIIFKEFLEELENTTDVLDDLANAIENVLIKNA